MARGGKASFHQWSVLALILVAFQLVDSSVATVHAAWHPRLQRGASGQLLDIEDVAPMKNERATSGRVNTNFLQVNSAKKSKKTKPCNEVCKERAKASAGESGKTAQANGPPQQQQAPMFYPSQQVPQAGPFQGMPYYANPYMNQNQFPQEATQQANPYQYQPQQIPIQQAINNNPMMMNQNPQQQGVQNPYSYYPPYGPPPQQGPMNLMRPVVMEQQQQQPMMMMAAPGNQNLMMSPMMEVAAGNNGGNMQPRLIEVMVPVNQQAPQQPQQFALRGANNANPEMVVLNNQPSAQQPAMVYEAVPQPMMMAQR